MTIAPAIATAARGAPPAVSTTPHAFGAAMRRQPAPTAAATTPPSPPRAALEAVDRARGRLDAVLAAARRGQTFTAQELLAMQADAYRYSQTIEVVSKIAEQAVQSVKQAVNTQV